MKCIVIVFICSAHLGMSAEFDLSGDKGDNKKADSLAVVAESEVEKPFKLNGYLDSYYFANSRGTISNLGVSGFERVFDQRANSFALGLVQVKGTYTADKVTGVVDLVFGNNADLANYGNVLSPLGVSGSTALNIKQAFLTWKFASKFSLTAGQFGTHIGYEVVDAPINYNYSLSYAFGNGPFYHTGVKVDYAMNDKVNLMVGLTNGLDSKDDNNRDKGIQAQIGFKPFDKWALYFNYFTTEESQKDKPNNTYTWYDLTTTYAVNDYLNLGLNAVLGNNDIGDWSGAAFYVNGNINKSLSLGARLEYFDNKEGGIYLVNETSGVAVTSYTLTGTYKVGDHFMIKPEYRIDAFKGDDNSFQFPDSKGNINKNNQSTYGVAMIIYF